MNHSFNVEDAQKYGVNAAILLENIRFWTHRNHANRKHCHDGVTYTYNSVRAYQELFPYIGVSAIKRALKKLVDAGEIVTGSFNKTSYDRTAWYGIRNEIIELAKTTPSISTKQPMEEAKAANQFGQNSQPIPDINTDITTDVNSDTQGKNKKRFIPPSLSEVQGYVFEKGYRFDPEAFIAHYESNGWMVGKNKMKSWKAACVTWDKRGQSNGSGFNDKQPRSPGDRVRAAIAQQERDEQAMGAHG